MMAWLLAMACQYDSYVADTGGLARFPAIDMRRPPDAPSPKDVTCTRCGAHPGEPCDRRTLGRHWYHMARVRAFNETP